MKASNAVRVRTHRRELAAFVSMTLASAGPTSLAATAGPAILPVTSCADDGSPGTLREVMLRAPSGSTIGLRALSCGTITLTQGTIQITSATLLGPGADRLTIDGNENGAIFVASSLEIDGLTLTRGRVSGDISMGGCLRLYGGVILRESRVTGCTAYGTRYASGGAIYTGTAYLYGSAITNNTVIATNGVAAGGGIRASYHMAVTNSTISGNVATGMASDGGGVFARGDSIIVSSTIDGNAADRGGGWYCAPSLFRFGSCTVINSTISGNVARDSGGGFVTTGLIADWDVAFFNSTVAHNVAETGQVGGVLIQSTPQPTITLQSSIFANNVAADASLSADIDTDLDETPPITGGNDVITSVGRIVPSPLIVADPRLAPLADNGGPTRTHALLPDSPAIDAGNNIAALGADQRGRSRVSGAAADIGAYEVQTDAIFANGFD